jgi:polyisoprenoid-binding protein YceI
MYRSALALLLACTCSTALATPYVFVARHSQGVMRWNHMGFSNPSAQFNQIEGTLDWDAADPTRSSVTATIKTTGIATGVPALDERFATSDLFDYAHNPLITFTSTRIEKAARPDHFVVTGDLALHGVTKPIALDMVINKIGPYPGSNAPSVGFEGTATLKRSDFGLGRYVPLVSDEIRIELTVEAVDAAAQARFEKAEAKKAADK